MFHRYYCELREPCTLDEFAARMKERWRAARVCYEEPIYEIRSTGFRVTLTPPAADLMRHAPEVLRFRCVALHPK